MRRRPAYPKAGDRVRLEVPLPHGATSRARRGTVVERSCGRSNSLRIRWDAGGGRPSTETWLADAAWHWSQNNLRVLPAGAGPEPSGGSPVAAEHHEAEDPWTARSGAGRTARPSAAPGSMAGAAFDEWEAALAAEKAPVADDSWETVLAGALGIASGPAAPPPAMPHPSAPPAPARAAAPAAPAPRPAPAPAARPAPAPAPAPAAPAAAWTGDDILPNRGGRKGRRR